MTRGSSSSACATTGATTRIGFLAPHDGYASVGGGRPAGRIQGDGQGAPCRRHRGHPRRRLQPHGRGQPPRADAGVQGHRQRRLLPADGRRPAPLHGLHGHRQHAQRPPSLRAAARHGQPALLGRRHACRRLPLRPRVRARPRAPRGRSPVGLLRPHPPGPDGQPRSSSSRSPGTSARAATRSATSRPTGRNGTAATATPSATSGAARPSRSPTSATASPAARPLRADRPAALREHQLRHRPRWLHAGRPRRYDEKHNEANGEDNRDGESHNRSWNYGAEGPTDDPGHQRRARARAAQPPGDAVPVPGRPDAARR